MYVCMYVKVEVVSSAVLYSGDLLTFPKELLARCTDVTLILQGHVILRRGQQVEQFPSKGMKMQKCIARRRRLVSKGMQL